MQGYISFVYQCQIQQNAYFKLCVLQFLFAFCYFPALKNLPLTTMLQAVLTHCSQQGDFPSHFFGMETLNEFG